MLDNISDFALRALCALGVLYVVDWLLMLMLGSFAIETGYPTALSFHATSCIVSSVFVLVFGIIWFASMFTREKI